jgi:HSP20 family protein
MAEKNTAMTPTREQRYAGEEPHAGISRSRPSGAAPFTTFHRLADDMSRMFEDVGFGRGWDAPFWRAGGAGPWAPEVEVFHRNDELTVRADLPGLKREEVSVDITDNSVTIQGERKHTHQEDREGFYRTERSYGSFCRVIPLPDGAITERAKANFRDGVLEVTMPAPPVARGRRLEITEGATK